MRLEVPFYKQESKNDCGPTVLKMALEYLGEHYSRERLLELVDSDKSGITWTLGLARAAAELRFKTEYYTTCLGFNPKNYELKYYQKEADDSSESKLKLEKLKLESHKLGMEMKEISLPIDKLLSKISKNCLAIILLDWSKIRETKYFIGHFVLIVGYDEENVYVHNQGAHNPQAFLPINRILFEEARKANGTDKDIIYIYRK